MIELIFTNGKRIALIIIDNGSSFSLGRKSINCGSSKEFALNEAKKRGFTYIGVVQEIKPSNYKIRREFE